MFPTVMNVYLYILCIPYGAPANHHWVHFVSLIRMESCCAGKFSYSWIILWLLYTCIMTILKINKIRTKLSAQWNCFLCPGPNARAYCFCPACPYACSSVAILTFAITFDPQEIEALYLAYICHLWCPFKLHHIQWLRDLDFDLLA